MPAEGVAWHVALARVNQSTVIAPLDPLLFQPLACFCLVPCDPRLIVFFKNNSLQVIELVMEVTLLRQNSIEHRLKALFTEGDANGDGVLSFEEFNEIVGRYTRT